MLQPMQQLLFTSGTAASRCKKKWGNEVGFCDFVALFQSVVQVGAVDPVGRPPGCPGIISSTFTRYKLTKKGQNDSKFSTHPRILQVQTECTEEIWMYCTEFPHSCSPKDCGAFFGALNKKKKTTTTTKTLRTRSVHCNRFSRSKNLDFFFILFLCVHGAAQPVAAAAAAADSSTAGPRGSKGTALKVTKRFFGRESKLLVWEVLYQLSISTSHTSLCLSSSLPREPVPRPPPSRLLGRGYFGGLCLFFVWYDDVLPTRSKIICRSVFDSFSVSLSAFLAKCVRDSQSSTLCPRVIECFSPCLVFFFLSRPSAGSSGSFRRGRRGDQLFGRRVLRVNFLEEKIPNLLFFPWAQFSFSSLSGPADSPVPPLLCRDFQSRLLL